MTTTIDPMSETIDLERFGGALAAFRRDYPAFDSTRVLDELRATEYARLDTQGQVYLDYTGGGLYAESQLREHMALLSRHVFGNPHSRNPTSMAMTHLVEQARAAVLEFFNASPEEYTAIFTPNASGALKLIGESYPFEAGDQYLLTFDNHNSVNGIREFACARGADVTYVPLRVPELRPDEDELLGLLDRADSGRRLFAYPAQSNFSGAQHPLEWIGYAQERGWHVLLDAAAFAPSNRLDLGRWHPDFVTLSFYKIFGYPTGVGCLLARKSALKQLRRPWFAGGTISIASVQGRGWHYLLPNEAGFEDGTVNYLSLPAVEIGLRHIAAIGVETIHERVVCLTGWLLKQMHGLSHSNGRPLVRFYGPSSAERRGGTIAFNFYDRDDRPHDSRRIEALAAEANISLRTGCFCNPGAGEIAHNITRDEMAECFKSEEPLSFDQFIALIQSIGGGKSASTVRISVGLASNFADVHRFIDFARGFLDKTGADIGVAAQACTKLRPDAG
ncbi:MAG TPA: aminotransferase class V-fold PLP-dependent enzyme [Roseiflexaceae bacterium]|nr:aminotransferase class V-fold PLP-dependent enzyme [Roseiflexaceae bacterium]